MPLLIALAAALAGPATVEFDHTHGQLDALLDRYVLGGLVDYTGLKENRAPLDAYLKGAGSVPPATFQGWSTDQQLAFLINVYNATTLQLIIDNYPVDSIKSLGSLLGSPWDKKCVLLFGKTISLDTLEHKIIRKNYAEPRIHFALVCAAKGCPPLRAGAFRGDQLDQQLNGQARAFLASAEKNHIDRDKKQLWLSPIFKWYRKDFEAASNSLTAFVAPYMGAAEGPAVLEGFDVAFTEYDWSLNDRRGAAQ